MAVVVVAELENGTQDFYDQVTAKVMPDGPGQLPEGGKVHIAGPHGNGWRVITVWDSEEDFHAFRNEKLLPAIREVSGEGAVAPDITAEPVYRLITA